MKISLASIHPRMLSGQVESLVGLAYQLKSLGHQVRVISAFSEESLLERPATAAASERPGSLLPKIMTIVQTVRKIIRESSRGDVLHLHLPTPSFAFLADLVKARTGMPTVVSFEAHLADVGELLGKGRLVHAPEFYLPRLLINNGLWARCTFRLAGRYVVSSELQRRELLALGYRDPQVEVIPNVPNLKKLVPWDHAEARKAMGLPKGQLVAYVGHYNHVKGADLLVRAFPTILEAHPDAYLVLAWSGLGNPVPVSSLVKELGLGQRVIQLEKVPVSVLLSACDVLVLPYRMTIGQSAFPSMLLEAMEIGTPLVTADLPLVRELIRHGFTGLLHEPEDPDSIANRVNDLLTNPGWARAMAQRQKRLMASELSPEALAERYVDLYQRSIREQKGLLPAPAGEPEVRRTPVWR